MLNKIITAKNYGLWTLLFHAYILLCEGIILISIGDRIKVYFPEYIVHSSELIRVAAFSLLLLISFHGTNEMRKFLIALPNRNKVYKLSPGDWPEKWMFNGKIEGSLNPTGLYIKSSRAGCLLENYGKI